MQYDPILYDQMNQLRGMHRAQTAQEYNIFTSLGAQAIGLHPSLGSYQTIEEAREGRSIAANQYWRGIGAAASGLLVGGLVTYGDYKLYNTAPVKAAFGATFDFISNQTGGRLASRIAQSSIGSSLLGRSAIQAATWAGKGAGLVGSLALGSMLSYFTGEKVMEYGLKLYQDVKTENEIEEDLYKKSTRILRYGASDPSRGLIGGFTASQRDRTLRVMSRIADTRARSEDWFNYGKWGIAGGMGQYQESMTELKSILNTGIDLGMFDASKNFDEFEKKFTETVALVKKMSSLVRKSKGEVMALMAATRTEGYFNTGDIEKTLSDRYRFAVGSGTDLNTVMMMTQAGSQMYSSMGLGHRAGADTSLQAFKIVGSGMRLNMLTKTDILNAGGSEAAVAANLTRIIGATTANDVNFRAALSLGIVTDGKGKIIRDEAGNVKFDINRILGLSYRQLDESIRKIRDESAYSETLGKTVVGGRLIDLNSELTTALSRGIITANDTIKTFVAQERKALDITYKGDVHRWRQGLITRARGFGVDGSTANLLANYITNPEMAADIHRFDIDSRARALQMKIDRLDPKNSWLSRFAAYTNSEWLYKIWGQGDTAEERLEGWRLHKQGGITYREFLETSNSNEMQEAIGIGVMGSDAAAFGPRSGIRPEDVERRSRELFPEGGTQRADIERGTLYKLEELSEAPTKNDMADAEVKSLYETFKRTPLTAKWTPSEMAKWGPAALHKIVRDEVLFLQAARKAGVITQRGLDGRLSKIEEVLPEGETLARILAGENTSINSDKGDSSYLNRISGAVLGGTGILAALGIASAIVAAPVVGTVGAVGLVAGGVIGGFYYGYEDELSKKAGEKITDEKALSEGGDVSKLTDSLLDVLGKSPSGTDYKSSVSNFLTAASPDLISELASGMAVGARMSALIDAGGEVEKYYKSLGRDDQYDFFEWTSNLQKTISSSPESTYAKIALNTFATRTSFLRVGSRVRYSEIRRRIEEAANDSSRPEPELSLLRTLRDEKWTAEKIAHHFTGDISKSDDNTILFDMLGKNAQDFLLKREKIFEEGGATALQEFDADPLNKAKLKEVISPVLYKNGILSPGEAEIKNGTPGDAATARDTAELLVKASDTIERCLKALRLL
ncbi:hypothetical protein EOM57_02775 [Candidatus Saccharibacteria bacterium]|nr:hypothetical protein [Candidatus Saccharibacteria bacterium]